MSMRWCYRKSGSSIQLLRATGQNQNLISTRDFIMRLYFPLPVECRGDSTGLKEKSANLRLMIPSIMQHSMVFYTIKQCTWNQKTVQKIKRKLLFHTAQQNFRKVILFL